MSAPPLSLNGWLRWDVVRRVLDELDDVETVLEIGAGLGAVAVRLAERYEYVGVERDPTSFAVARDRLARARSGTIVLGDPSAIDAERRFDLVGAFEVLEHVEDDAGAVRELGRQASTAAAGSCSRCRRGGSAGVRPTSPRATIGATTRDDLVGVLAGAGLEDVRVRRVRVPARLPAPARVEPARPASPGPGDRAAHGGEWPLVPARRRARAGHAGGLVPFRLAQRPFGSSELGTGLVAVARRAG